MFRFFLLLCLVAVCNVAAAQPEKQYVFTHFSTSNGLASNIVRSVTQDNQGFIWLTTISGLQRYDGNKFITFRNKPSDPLSIPSDEIYHITEDGKQRLWIATGTHVGIFNRQTFRYEDKPIYGNTAEEPFVILFIDQDYTGTPVMYIYGKGIFRYDEEKNQFMPVALFRMPKEWDPIDISISEDRNEIIYGCRPGFAVYNLKTGNINLRGHIEDSIPLLTQLDDERSVVTIFDKGKDDLWYSTWPPLGGAPFFQYRNFKTGETKKLSLYEAFPSQGYYEINGLMKQSGGRLWFYGRSFIVEYLPAENAFRKVINKYRDEQSIKFETAHHMFEDRQHNIWVSTDNGVFVFNPDAQSFFSHSLLRPDGSGLDEGPAQTALQLKDGSIFVGAWGTGLYYFDSALNRRPLPAALKKYQAPYSIWDIRQSKDNTVWMGVQNGVLLIYDPVKQSVIELQDSVFRQKTIRQISEDETGNIWFGTQSGAVVKWDKNAAAGSYRKGYSVIKKNDTAIMHKVYADGRGYVWAGSYGKGLFKYNIHTNKLEDHITTTCPPGHRLWNNIVNDIYRYNDSLILIACGSLDVLNTNTNEITHITTEDGLPSNTVYSIEKDKTGTLWLGMAHGLCRMNLEKKIFFVYDRRDGISYDNFNPAGVVKLTDGRLVYPTDHNFIVFNPASIAGAPAPPPAIITDFKLAGKSVLVDSLLALKKIELQYDNSSVAIEFSTLNYISQDKLHFHYKLDGIDKVWNETTDINQAVYSYLPPGEYTLHVKAENSNGDSGNETVLHIQVLPPFYATWWFYCLVVLAGIGIIYWIDKERINKLLTMQQVRTEIAGNLHDEINTTLSNINLLSEMAKIKADKDITRSKEYIDQISDKSRKMMESMDDMLWSLDPANDSMEKTILRMKEFADGLQNEYPVNILMEVDQQVLSVKAGMKIRHELFIIFKAALMLVAQSGSFTETLVNIDKEAGFLSLKVYDKTVVLQTTDPAINSLLNEMEKRAVLINATLDVLADHTGMAVVLQMHV